MLKHFSIKKINLYNNFNIGCVFLQNGLFEWKILQIIRLFYYILGVMNEHS